MDIYGRNENLRREITRMTRGMQRFPVDLKELYARAGLSGPFDLYGEHYNDYLEFHTPEDGAPWRDGMLGMIDPRTLVVFMDERMGERRARFVAAHELMHFELGHTAYMLKRPREAAARRDEMESEASEAAVELLAPAEMFVSFVRHVTPLGARAGLLEVKHAAHKFQITNYTAMRRFVATDNLSSALLSVRPPRNYRGSSPKELRLRAFASDRWASERDRPGYDVAPFSRLDVTSLLGARAANVLSRPHDDRTQGHLAEAAAQLYDARAELVVTPHSVHILLTR